MQNCAKKETLAVIGVGQLATFFLSGLRCKGDDRKVFLSPHNRIGAEKVAQQYRCEVAADTQAAVSQASIVLLSTRPEHVATALEPLTLKDNQLVISAVAGLSVNTLSQWVEPAKVVRCLPGCGIEIGEGGIPLFPKDERAQRLLDVVGEVIPLDHEGDYEKMSVPICAIGCFFKLYGQLQQWLADNGIPESAARKMSLLSAHSASALALKKSGVALNELVDTIAWEGTYTLAGLNTMEQEGGFQALYKACDEVLGQLNE